MIYQILTSKMLKAFVHIKADLYKISLPRSSDMQNSVPIVYAK